MVINFLNALSDENGIEDELGVCAENLAEMDDLSDSTEMYVCTNYLKEEAEGVPSKLRIQVGRPNYNSKDLEAATIILSVSISIDEGNNEGPPMYYSVASGQNKGTWQNKYFISANK